MILCVRCRKNIDHFIYYVSSGGLLKNWKLALLYLVLLWHYIVTIKKNKTNIEKLFLLLKQSIIIKLL